MQFNYENMTREQIGLQVDQLQKRLDEMQPNDLLYALTKSAIDMGKSLMNDKPQNV